MKARRQLTQVAVEEMILDDIEALESATDEYDVLCEKVARAEVAYRSKKASAFMRYNGTIRDKEAYAEKVSVELMEDYKVLSGRKEAQKEVLWTIRNRLEALRSLNANVREQV